LEKPSQSYFVTTPFPLKKMVLECVQSAGLPPFEETAQPDDTEYFVYIRAYFPPSQGGEQSSSGTSLKARRRIVRNTTNAMLVHTDVAECIVAASAKAPWNAPASGSGGAGTSSKPTNIQPLLERFDQCVRAKSYSVKDPDQLATK
jgi:hypothetical protein